MDRFRCLYFIAWNRLFHFHRDKLHQLSEDLQPQARAKLREEAARAVGVPEGDVVRFVEEVRKDHG